MGENAISESSLLCLHVNGHEHKIVADPFARLLDVLREDLQLAGTRRGCDEGACGACTVLIDGDPRRACLTLAHEVTRQEVRTVEGLGRPGALHPLQEAFLERGALQCGFCTAGLLMAAVALLERKPEPDEDAVRHWLAGNLCRCTGYRSVVDAVLAAATRMREARDVT